MSAAAWDDLDPALAQRDADWAEWKADLDERDMLESVDTMEAIWDHRMRVWAAEREVAYHQEDRRGIDSRLFGP